MIDTKTALDFHKIALHMAQETHEQDAKRSPDTILETAKKYFDFMTSSSTKVETSAPRLTVAIPDEILNSVIVKDAPITELQELRRLKILDLDILSNEIRRQGFVPA